MGKRYKIILLIIALVISISSFSFPVRVLAEGGDGSGGGGGQDEPLSFVSSSPSDGATGVDTGVHIRMNFNKNIAYYSSNKSHFSMKDNAGNSVGISVQLIDDPDDVDVRRRATIIPDSELSPGTEYSVTVTAGLESKSGNFLGSGKTITFTTKEAAPPSPTITPEPTPIPTPTAKPTPKPTHSPARTASPTATNSSSPTSSDVQPSPSATDVDAAPVSTSVPTETPALQSPGLSASPTGSGNGSNKGKPVVLVTSNINDGQSGVPVDSSITLTFSKNVVYMAVRDTNKSHFSLLDSVGNQVPINVRMADDQIEPEKKNIVIIQPAQPLQKNMQYKLVISKGLQSKSGDTTQDDIVISFSTFDTINAWPFIIGGAIIVVAAGCILYFFVIKKRNKVKKGEGDAQG